MTNGVKSASQTPVFEMGDRVRLRKRLNEYVKTPISRKSVGVVADVHTSAVDGSVGYTVVFHKENEWPTLEAHQLVRLPPKPAPKAEAGRFLTPPPELPDDVK